MTRLRVRLGRWLASESDGVDQGHYDQANDLVPDVAERLEHWAETDRPVDDFVAAYDVGIIVATISDAIKLSARSVLSDLIDSILSAGDADPLVAVRLHELRSYYFNDHVELGDEHGE